jgi:hypothetical protein
MNVEGFVPGMLASHWPSDNSALRLTVYGKIYEVQNDPDTRYVELFLLVQ